VSTNVEVFLYLVPIFIGSLTLHELAHGWTAYKLGDPTAKLLGRLSLNPIVHMDPLGTLMFMVSYWTGFLFGWAKPVPVDPSNFRGHPQRGMAVVAAAGPATNFVLAILCALIAKEHGSFGEIGDRVLGYAFLVNIVLGVFNLIPIPPLDGSRIVGAFMDRRTWAQWSSLDQYGMVFLLVLIFLFNNQFAIFFTGATSRVARVIADVVGTVPTITYT
jgi:Zn-dependent protease